VCAIPPAIQSRITVSAFALIFGLAQELNNDAGSPDAIAARVAAPVFCKNSLLFHLLFMIMMLNKSIETLVIIV
jgi:hypothetical protein